MQKDLSFIFEQKPMQWGLRGNPYLWDEMQELCVGKSLDTSKAIRDAISLNCCAKSLVEVALSLIKANLCVING